MIFNLMKAEEKIDYNPLNPCVTISLSQKNKGNGNKFFLLDTDGHSFGHADHTMSHHSTENASVPSTFMNPRRVSMTILNYVAYRDSNTSLYRRDVYA